MPLFVSSPVRADEAAPVGGIPSALACNPKDPRLKGVELPKGRGPEAEAAMACLWLQYLERKGAPVAPITVSASPGIPKAYLKTIRQSLAIGDRLTGQWADPGRSYEFVLANDPKWMCAKGGELVEPRSIGKGTQPKSWAQTEQSGCPGAKYFFGSWQGKNLGPDGATFFSWGLFTPKDWREVSRDPKRVGSPIWYLAFATHEHQHQLQGNVSNGVTFNGGGGSGRRNDGPVGWYSEGQAEYIGFMSAEISGARKDMRKFKLSQAREMVRDHGMKDLMITDNYTPKGWNSMYAAGFFAYEYLLAHYGLEKTVTWWREWNTEECGSGMREPCWMSKAPEIFGVSKDELISTLNDYIRRQIA